MDSIHGDGLPAAPDTTSADEPVILEEIEVEDLAVDGICGVY
jgi:mycofactocin precursor